MSRTPPTARGKATVSATLVRMAAPWLRLFGPLLLAGCIIQEHPYFAASEGGTSEDETQTTESDDAGTETDGDESGSGTAEGETGTSGNDETTDDTGSTEDSVGSEETGPEPTEHRIFVSSTLHTGMLGGRAGANGTCQDLASEAGLDGSWVALLSTQDGDAIDTVGIAGPVYNMLGEIVATGPADLWDGTIENHFRQDENGNLVGQRGWTGTLADGTSSGELCDDWSTQTGGFKGTLGDSFSMDSGWVDDGTGGCGQSFHVFCVSL
jgi:hypothetical protein